eukprot:GHRR01032579.1.p1 GENE.GHRR01032579.1~~GHRR01032579.1.p1  ORF type:complete len:106 (-),score=25.51 GHRR01032579.1:17-334(-)
MDLGQAGSTNSFGDDQLLADIHADDTIFRHLQQCPAVASASSEEKSDIQHLGGQGYTVGCKLIHQLTVSKHMSAKQDLLLGCWPFSRTACTIVPKCWCGSLAILL